MSGPENGEVGSVGLTSFRPIAYGPTSPFTLVDIDTREAVTVGSVRDTIRAGDALRWQTLLAIEAPSIGEPHGRVSMEYSDGFKASVPPSYIGCEFVPIETVQDNTSQEK